MSESAYPARRAAATVVLSAGARRERARRRRAESLEARERPLFHELVSGIARRELTLEAVLAGFSDRPARRIDPTVRAALLIGLHQLLFLDRVPGHAAVDSAVACVPRRLGNGPRRFVNAVLRAVERERRPAEHVRSRRVLLRAGGSDGVDVGREVLPDPERDRLGWAAAQWGYGREALEILLQDFEMDDVERLLEDSGRPPLTTVRRRGGRCTAAELIASARADGLVLGEESGGVHVLEGGGDLTAAAAFRAGWLAVQGAFAARVAPLCAPHAGERLLDLCAPPGGKACHLAELAPRARVVALARDEGGARRIRENAARLACPLEIRRQTRPGDGLGGAWDAVLLDVPCSNSGVLGRRPEARLRLTRAALAGLRAEQEALLRVGLRLVGHRPGARVVYATCSILECENAGLVRAVVAGDPRLEVEREIAANPLSCRGDGGYACLIRRRGGP